MNQEKTSGAVEGAEKEVCDSKWKEKCRNNNGGVSSVIYCLGLIGAAVYYIQNADTFGAGLVGVLKAIVWPAFLVYKLLGFLGM